MITKIKIDSITIFATYASVNGTLNAGDNLPVSSANFNVSKDDAYARRYEPGQEYEIELTPVAVEPPPSDTDTPAEANVGSNPNSRPAGRP